MPTLPDITKPEPLEFKVARVLSGHCVTNDVTTFGSVIRKWFLADEKARAAFIKWFEALP